MTSEPKSIPSRRRFLTAIGAASVGALAGGTILPARLTAQPPSYTHYTYAQSPDGGPNLRVSWVSTYNGQRRNESSGLGDDESATVETYDPESDGPLVLEENVLPGDSGTISIGLVAESMDTRVRCQITDGNGGSQFGQLASRLTAALWHDTGLFGIGACSGGADVPSNPDYEGTLTELGSRFGSEGSEQLWLGGGHRRCVSEGDRLCLGFAWEFPRGHGNQGREESASFGLSFLAEECGGLL